MYVMRESRIVLFLASILSFRMLGLFMIYPVFALYAPHFNDATPFLMGIALGIYGLTQALFQLPLSMLSDRIGRKPIIIGGLFVFALGSIVSAVSQNIYFVIVGRALQGSGAIGSTLMAYASDVTSIENRTKAIALLGMAIGLSFALAMVFGPLINTWFHLAGIFWMTAFLALVGIFIQQYYIPSPSEVVAYHPNEPFLKIIKELLQHSGLNKLNISILFLHALLTANFIVIPLLFSEFSMESSNQWKIYLPVLVGAFLVSFPVLMVSEKKKRVKATLLAGISILAIAELLFLLHPFLKMSVIVNLFIFFTGFTLLEAMLPSLISKLVLPIHRGSAMGIYSSFQFLGIFMGGALAGLVHHNNFLIFSSGFFLCVIWLIYMASMDML
jgi:MFS family permease